VEAMMHTVGHLKYQLKRLQKNYVKKKCNKTKKRTPLYFLTTPSTPSKEFENDCPSMDGNNNNFTQFNQPMVTSELISNSILSNLQSFNNEEILTISKCVSKICVHTKKRTKYLKLLLRKLKEENCFS
jgi:hypothetical protein